MLPIADLALSIAIAFVGVFDEIVKIVAITTTFAGKWESIFTKLKLATVFEFFNSKLVNMVGLVKKLATYITSFLSLSGKLASVGAILATWAPKLAPFFSIFKLLLGPVGWVIIAFQAISGAIDGWSRGEGWTALAQAIRGMLAAIIPFGDEILSWMNWAKEPIVANVVKKVDIQGEQVDDEQYSSVVRSSRAEDQEYAAESRAESNNSLNNILAAINNLNSNLESGKIGVYVDGQLVSATIARQTNFKGGFGMNVA